MTNEPPPRTGRRWETGPDGVLMSAYYGDGSPPGADYDGTVGDQRTAGEEDQSPADWWPA